MMGIQGLGRLAGAQYEMSLAARDPEAFQRQRAQQRQTQLERAGRPQMPHSASDTAGLAAWEAQTPRTTATPATQRSPVGRAGALGLISEQLVGGLAKKKKKAAARMAQSRQGLSSQAMGSQRQTVQGSKRAPLTTNPSITPSRMGRSQLSQDLIGR